MALSDQAQAAIMIVALVLIAIGSVVTAAPQSVTALPSPQNDYVGLAFIIIGVIGAALKEYLGIKPAPAKAA